MYYLDCAIQHSFYCRSIIGEFKGIIFITLVTKKSGVAAQKKCTKQRIPVGKHKTVGGQPFISGIEYRVQHGLVEQAVTHPLGDDNVHLVDSFG